MPNEASALPELLAALPDYDAVHAALLATEGGRRFLAEFAARNRHADTTMIVAAVARVEAAIRGEGVPPPPAAATGAGELVEIAAAIDRIWIALAAGATPAPRLAAAVERIQDLAFMLHERAVDTRLRDALDTALAELAAAARAPDRGVVELLHALASRVTEMMGERGGSQPAASTDDLPPRTNLFAIAASEGEAFARGVASLAAAAALSAEASLPVSAPPVKCVAATTPPADAPEEPYAVDPESGEGAEPPAIEIAAPASAAAEPQPAAAIEPEPAAAPAEAATLEVSDSAAILTQAFSDDVFVVKEASPAVAPPPEGEVDRVDQAPELAPPPNEAAAPAEEAAALAGDAATPAEEAAAPAQDFASQVTAGPEEDPADLFEPQPDSESPATPAQAATAEDTPASAAAPVEPAQPAEPREPARVVPPPSLRAILRPPLSDPRAAVRDLSDEERIALFS